MSKEKFDECSSNEELEGNIIQGIMDAQEEFGIKSTPLKEILVKKDQKVKQGDIIGTVGSTGRSTGAHLDIRLNWFQVRLDPATVLDIKY